MLLRRWRGLINDLPRPSLNREGDSDKVGMGGYLKTKNENLKANGLVAIARGNAVGI